MTVRLDYKLINKYPGLMRMEIRKGDRVKVVRGSYKDPKKDLRVVDVDPGNNIITLEGATVSKRDGKQVPRRFHPSNLVITRLNLSDPKRRNKIKRIGLEVVEEEEEEEEEGEEETEEEIEVVEEADEEETEEGGEEE
jgi:large subunit ribosomal protein L24